MGSLADPLGQRIEMKTAHMAVTQLAGRIVSLAAPFVKVATSVHEGAAGSPGESPAKAHMRASMRPEADKSAVQLSLVERIDIGTSCRSHRRFGIATFPCHTIVLRSAMVKMQQQVEMVPGQQV